jgi:hypothetical protein
MLAIALALAPACKSKDNTKIVVGVWSDLAVPSKLDRVRIDVNGNSKTSDSFALTSGSEASKSKLPVELQLVPLAAKDETFTVTAVGLLAGNPIVSQTARVSFVSGKALLLKLFLGQACVDVTCPDASFTCSAGACNQPIIVTPLPPYNPSNLVGPDAGSGIDSGRIDSAVIDSGASLDSTGREAPTVDPQAADSAEDAPPQEDAPRTCRLGESQFGLCTFSP